MLQKRLLGVLLGGLVLSNTVLAGFSGLLGKLNDLVNEINLPGREVIKCRLMVVPAPRF